MSKGILRNFAHCREDGLLECLRIGDFQSLLEPIVSVKQEPSSVWRGPSSLVNPNQDPQGS